VPGNIERIRSVLEWDRLRAGEGPPSRNLLLNCAKYLGVRILPVSSSTAAIVMKLLNEFSGLLR
jgi:hypothetical protein